MFSGITDLINDLSKDPSGTLITLAYVAFCILFSLILHECAHGWVALKCGDPTAKMMGRLTLNPAKHLDLLGTICMVFMRFGWAKPVPVNPRNFRKFRRDYILVSLAGIVTNLLICILSLSIASLMCRVIYDPKLLDEMRAGYQDNFIDIYNVYIPARVVYDGSFHYISGFINKDAEWMLYIQRLFLILAQMNLGLAIFNLLPVPPLDGYRFLDMFVFKGNLAMNRSIMNVVQIVFLIVLLSGGLTNLLFEANKFVFGILCDVISLMV